MDLLLKELQEVKLGLNHLLFLDSVPEESIKDYKNPDEITDSLNKAISDWKRGKVSNKL